MALDINWITGVITIPKADTTLFDAGPPEIRTYDVNVFRLELGTLVASEAGRPFPRTHDHDLESTLAGETYARKIRIIAPYTITFEDGQYSVRLFGANHNIDDVNNKNQVSIVTNNSAGLINTTDAATDLLIRKIAARLALIKGSPTVDAPNRITNSNEDIDVVITEGPDGTFTSEQQ